MYTAKHKILYVDDEPINLEAFKIAFVFNSKLEIVTAESGDDGIILLEKYADIKAVISDMFMPEMDGITFIKKVKEKYNEVPCFILSGYDKTDEIKLAIDQGLLNKFIMKPYDKDELEQSVLNAIEKMS